MVRVFKWLAAGGLAIGLVLMAAYGLSRAMAPTKAEQQALQALRPGSPPAGSNGFAQLWLLPYAVPAEE
jgi:flagellar biogenesis protein FliO